jgi:hypothetical protein
VRALALALILTGCGTLGVTQDETGAATVTDSETGSTLVVPAPETTPETSATGSSIGTIAGALTGNPGIGIAAGALATWLLAMRAKKKPVA